MSSVPSIYTGTVSGNSTTERSTGDEMGKDEFLEILVTQLQNQDPLDPMNDTEFIAQMAEFSALEQMQNVATASLSQQATSMIGSYVKAEVTTDGVEELVYGKVISTRSVSGEMYLVLDNGREVSLSEATATMNSEGLWNEAESLEGSTVYVREYDSSGDTSGVQLEDIVAAKLLVGSDSSQTIKLLTSDCYTTSKGTLKKAEDLVGKTVIVRDFDSAGNETDCLYEVKVTGAKMGIARDGKTIVAKLVIGTDDDENDIEVEYSDICDMDYSYEMKDIYNIIANGESEE